jgi:hypothetical protein
MKGNNVLLSALWYVKNMNWSVIPIGKDKKPLVKWEEFQKRKPTEEEINNWWKAYPNANIGIVTGKVSNLAVLDIDDPNIDNDIIHGIEEFLNPPTCITPRGGRHLYFTYPDIDLRNAASIIPKVDIRAEGGYVVAPPSIDGSNKIYTWEPNKKINEITLTAFPQVIIALTTVNMYKQEVTNIEEMFVEGRRDEDMFHMANIMVKGGANPSEIKVALTNLAMSCVPPFDIKEIPIKIESAMKRAAKRERNLTDEVRRWVDIQDGYFEVNTLYKDLGISTPQERGNCYVAMNRLSKEGIIEKYGKKAGQYRIANREVEIMDWESASSKDMDILYPLGIERLVVTYPSNIIIIAGASNSGKTTFALDFARLNCKKYKINYFNSEMGEGELKMRLNLYQNATIDDWRKITFYERSNNFDDVIKPDQINIIDYLEVLNDFWMVGEQIKAIHSKLTTGIAVIAIQKTKNTELGRGGTFGTEKPRLYLSMDYGKIKIVKAKNWRTNENPNGMVNEFNIAGGWKFLEKEGGWCIPYETTI